MHKIWILFTIKQDYKWLQKMEQIDKNENQIEETKETKTAPQKLETPKELLTLISNFTSLTSDKSYLIVDYSHETDTAVVTTVNSNLVLDEKLVVAANNTIFNRALGLIKDLENKLAETTVVEIPQDNTVILDAA